MLVVVGKMTLAQVFVPALLFPPVNIFSPTLHIHLPLHVDLTRKTDKRRSLRIFQKAVLFWKSGRIGWKSIINSYYLEGRCALRSTVYSVDGP